MHEWRLCLWEHSLLLSALLGRQGIYLPVAISIVTAAVMGMTHRVSHIIGGFSLDWIILELPVRNLRRVHRRELLADHLAMLQAIATDELRLARLAFKRLLLGVRHLIHL